MTTIEEILKDAQLQLSTTNISAEEKKSKTEIAAIDSQQQTWYVILLAAALLWKWLGNILETTHLGPWLTRMSNWAKPFFTRIKSWIMPIYNALDKALNWVNITLHSILDPLRKWFDNNLLSLLKIVKETSDTLTDFVGTVYTKLFGPFEDLLTDFKALTYVVSDITRIFLPEFSRNVKRWIDDIEERYRIDIVAKFDTAKLLIKTTEYDLTNRIAYVKDTLDQAFYTVNKWKDDIDVYVKAAFSAPGQLSREASIWQSDQYGVEMDWAKLWKEMEKYRVTPTIPKPAPRKPTLIDKIIDEIAPMTPLYHKMMDDRIDKMLRVTPSKPDFTTKGTPEQLLEMLGLTPGVILPPK